MADLNDEQPGFDSEARYNDLHAMMTTIAEQVASLATHVTRRSPVRVQRQPTPPRATSIDGEEERRVFSEDGDEEGLRMGPGARQSDTHNLDNIRTDFEAKALRMQQQIDALAKDNPRSARVDWKTGYAAAERLNIPQNLRLPAIDKYDGKRDPAVYMKTFVATMVPLRLGDEALLQLFPRYLTGAAERWYHQTKEGEFETLDELATKFINRFSMYSMIAEPEEQLKQIVQGERETFRSFIDRWINTAAEIDDLPPMTKQIEMIRANLNREYAMATASRTYANLKELIVVGRNIDRAAANSSRRVTPITPNSTSRGYAPTRPRPEIHAVSDLWSPTHRAAQPPRRPPQKLNNFPRDNPATYAPASLRHFDNLGAPLSAVLERLQERGLLQPLSAPAQPFVSGKFPHLKCAYHQYMGHETDYCMALRHKVQDLIDSDTIPKPNVTTNPLPEHDINLIELEESQTPIEILSEASKDSTEIAPRRVRMETTNEQTKPLKAEPTEVELIVSKYKDLQALVLGLTSQVQMLASEVKKLTQATFTQVNTRAIGVKRKREYLQQFVPQRKRRYEEPEPAHSEQASSDSVNKLPIHPGGWVRPLSKVFELLADRDYLTPLPPPENPFTLYSTSSYCKYHQMTGHDTDQCGALRKKIRDMLNAGTIPHPDSLIDYEEECIAVIDTSNKDIWKGLKTLKTKVKTSPAHADIWLGLKTMTLSDEAPKGEGVNATRRGTDYRPTFAQQVPPIYRAVPPPTSLPTNTGAFTNPPPAEALLSQMKKTTANVSIWELLMFSSSHRQAVLSELSKAQIPTSTSPDELVALIAQITSSPSISFEDNELPATGPSHARALYVTVSLNGNQVPSALVDNGSALNICPWRTAEKIGVTKEMITPSDLFVKGFDNSRREIMGTVTLRVDTSGVSHDADFTIIDMQPTYNIILGRPWLHQARAIASTLHQKLKFIHDGQVKTLKGEDSTSIPGSIHTATPEVELSGYEVAPVFVETSNELPYSSATLHMMLRMGHFPGMGLGRLCNGIINPIILTSNRHRYGLGYQPLDDNDVKATGDGTNPIPLTLNGQFVKEGESVLYFDFPEPFVLRQRIGGPRWRIPDSI